MDSKNTEGKSKEDGGDDPIEAQLQMSEEELQKKLERNNRIMITLLLTAIAITLVLYFYFFMFRSGVGMGM